MIIAKYLGYLLIVCGFFWLISESVAWYFGAPFWRSNRKGIKEILQLANLKPGERFFDLGSGNGKVLSHATKKYGVKGYGIEVSPFQYILSYINTYNNKLIKIRFANFEDFTLEKADIIYCRLEKNVLKKIQGKLLKELKPGARLISYQNPVPDLEPFLVYQYDNDKIYYYKI